MELQVLWTVRNIQITLIGELSKGKMKDYEFPKADEDEKPLG